MTPQEKIMFDYFQKQSEFRRKIALVLLFTTVMAILTAVGIFISRFSFTLTTTWN